MFYLRSLNIVFLSSLALMGFSIASVAAATFDQLPCTGDFGILCMLSAVPIPAAIWLFGTALIGLVGFSKREKQLNVQSDLN